MNAPGFQEFRRAMFRHYGEGRYDEALAAAREAWARFPEHEARTSYRVACLLCRVGEPDEALRVLEAARGHGHWWGEGVLTKDPDLEPLWGRPDFRRLVADCGEVQRAAQAAAKPEVLVFSPDDLLACRKYPSLLALHGRGGSAVEYAFHFRPATAQGWVAAFPQGTQLEGEGMYTWDDPKQAEQEVAWAWEEVSRAHPVDPSRVILAGASQGAALAISLALKGAPISSQGFIAVIPSTTGSEAWLAAAPDAAGRGVRGWILTGEDDPRCPQVRAVHEEVVRAGLVCELVVVPRLGHQFPDDFPVRLAQALDYLLGPEE